MRAMTVRLRSVVLGSPDPRALGRFYEQLLGWTVADDEPDWVRLEQPDGPMCLSFQREPDHVRPTWPAGPGDQQMQLHLDLAVDDLEAAVRRAEQLGAVQAAIQPEELVRVMLDPAGHPFCLVAPGG
jgi:predicted enzyme related to lactoylglutathione lyase